MQQKGNTHSNTAPNNSARSWEVVFNSIQDLIVILDIDNRILDANPAVYAATGLREDQVIGHRCHTIFHCTEKPPCECPYEKLKKSFKQESLTMEMEAMGRKYLVTVSPIFDNESSQITRVVHIAKDITELNITATALKDSEKKFQGIFQAASDGILLADTANKKFVDANDAICEMLGYTRNELLQLNVSDIHPQKDLQQVIETFEKQVKGEIVVASELPVKRKDGSVFFAEISSKPVVLDGQPFLIGIFRDNKYRLKTEQLIQKEKDTAQKYFDISGVMLAVLNKTGQITHINKKGCEILHVTEDEALGKNWFEHYLPKTMVDEVRGVFNRIISGDIEPVEYYENAVLTSHGTERTIAFHNTILKNEKGHINGVLFSGNDITDHKKAEASVKAQQSLFQDAIDAQVDTFFVFDPFSGKALQWNKAFEDISGYSKEEITSLKAPDSYYSKEDIQKAGKYIEKVFSGDSGTVELDLLCKNGQRIPTEYSVSIIKDVAGKSGTLIAIGRDITDRKRAEQEKADLEKQLHQAQKLESIGVFAGGIAHDFNNILSAILGNLNLVRHIISPTENKAHTFLEEAEKASIRAQGLTHQLLTFSKGGEPLRQTSSISNIIRDSVSFILRGTGINYELDIQDDLWPVDADPGQISQVVQNIVLNARHAMPRGGVLRITCSKVSHKHDKPSLLKKNKRYVKVDISDSGIGIPPNIIDNIFDPYFSTKKEGSGLGLSICHSIINKHHGHISVKSEQGKGTIFSFYLLASDKTPAEKKTDHLEKVFNGKGLTILIMDDDEQIRNTAGSMLSHFGCTTLQAHDGEEAVEIYRSSLEKGKPIDVVIMDLTIPGGMGGKEAIAEILKLDPRARVVVSSGYSNDPIMAEHRKYGLCAAIVKPYLLKELARTIKEAVRAA